MDKNPLMSVFLGAFIIAVVIALVVALLEVIMHKQNADQMSQFEMRRLYFASGVLASMGLIFIMSMAMYYFNNGDNDAGKRIFDACSKIIPPIITLILGYYFGTSQSRPQAFRDRMSHISDSKALEAVDQLSERQGSAQSEHDEE